MCCFSGPVTSVAATRIFARVEGERQYLAYEMTFSSVEDLAMVLPLPVQPGVEEDAVAFINLDTYPSFFEDLNRLFPVMRSRRGRAETTGLAKSALVVHTVGIYEASFVPTIADLSRLDPRFRLPDGVWDALPDYADYGFAVFKLAGGAQQKVHPLALSFPTRHPDTLFFPTLHVHDGQVHHHAHFDHVLYCQPTRWHLSKAMYSVLQRWSRSPEPASKGVAIQRTQGMVDGEHHVFKKSLAGPLENRDHRL